MSYQNSKLPPFPFPKTLAQFIPWNKQINDVLRQNSASVPFFSNYYSPPGLCFQQQNNYYNSTFAYPPHQAPYPNPSLPLYPHFTSQQFNSHQPPSQLLPPAKKEVPIINLDEDSPEVIVIQESEPLIIPVKKAEIVIDDQVKEKVEKLKKLEKAETVKKEQDKTLLEKIDGKRKLDKKVLESGLDFILKGGKTQLSLKRQNRREKNEKKEEEKKEKKIVKKKAGERFVYRLKPHERKLMELSQCRQYLPGQIMTGPQFQARIPSFKHTPYKKSWLKIRRENLLLRLQY